MMRDLIKEKVIRVKITYNAKEVSKARIVNLINLCIGVSKCEILSEEWR